MRNLIRCKLGSDGLLTITQKVNKLTPTLSSTLAPSTLLK